ncbi:MAG TPA: S4 domain-containing protein [Solimonas sp.]|nr:S4 domain-containing protein [Solimonas sp.]
MTGDGEDAGSVRLDKWLWAARFFKTRRLAKAAIEAGHVRLAGERCKVSRSVTPGMQLSVRQGWDELEVLVRAVAEQRRDATFARTLYEETEASRVKREALAIQRKAANTWEGDARPDKKQRRLIHRFKRSLS